MKPQASQPPTTRKPASLSTKIGVSLGACLLSVALVEGAIRLTGLFEPPPYPPRCSRPELYEAHSPYGYRLHPSQTMHYDYPRYNPRRLTIVSNRFGFRDTRDPTTPHEGPRIVVLGDSFAFGEGVEQAERFTNVLEQRQPGWRVDNLGMVGYGLDNMLRALEEVGVHAHPNIVLVCIYGDDLRRVRPHIAGIGFEIPRYVLSDGQLASVPYPRRRVWDALHVVELGRRIHWKTTDSEARLNAALLERIVEVAREHGAQTGIVFLPAEQDLPVDQQRRQWLSELAEANGCPFLDLTEPILQAGRAAFIERNFHYNAAGHQIVAEHLETFLANQLPDNGKQLLPRPSAN
jgi:lysophospholipase L1-like esterase